MWDDVIDANRRAMAVVNKQRAARNRSPARCGHYATWLDYALLQKGQRDEATKMLIACRDAAFSPSADSPEQLIESWADMAASHVMGGGVLEAAQRWHARRAASSPRKRFAPP